MKKSIKIFTLVFTLMGCAFHLTAVGSGMNLEVLGEGEPSKYAYALTPEEKLQNKGFTLPDIRDDTGVKIEATSTSLISISNVCATRPTQLNSYEDGKKMTEDCMLKSLAHLKAYNKGVLPQNVKAELVIAEHPDPFVTVGAKGPDLFNAATNILKIAFGDNDHFILHKPDPDKNFWDGAKIWSDAQFRL